MHVKGICKRYQIIRRTIRREMGIVYIAMLLIQFVILPVFLWIILKDDRLDFYEKYEKFLIAAQTILPMLSAFWMIFSSYDWTESAGRELYYLYMKKPERVAFYYAGMFHIGQLLSYVIYGKLLRGFFYEYVRISAACVLFQGIGLCMMFLVRSQIVSCFLIVFYTMYSYVCFEQGSRHGFGYFAAMPESMQSDYRRALLVGAVGIGFWLVGMILIKSTERRH